MHSKFSPSSAPALLEPACVFGPAHVAQAQGLVPGTDGRPFFYQASPSAGRVYLALEGGRVISLKAGVCLRASADGWLLAEVPSSGAPALRVTRLIEVRAIGHDEADVRALAQQVEWTWVRH